MATTPAPAKTSFLTRFDGWFDKLPPGVQAALFVAFTSLATGGLDWVQKNYTTWHLPQPFILGIGILVPIIAGAITTATKRFGKGKVAPVAISIPIIGGTVTTVPTVTPPATPGAKS